MRILPFTCMPGIRKADLLVIIVGASSFGTRDQRSELPSVGLIKPSLAAWTESVFLCDGKMKCPAALSLCFGAVGETE